MAVPKKRTSKTKKNIRKANWKRKAVGRRGKAYSLAVVALKREEKRKEEKESTDENREI